MKLFLNDQQFIETDKGYDLSIPLINGENNVNAWYADQVKIEPVVAENFIGDVNQGGSVNFRNLFLNPHGNGTHTECVGHISKEFITINTCLKEFHFFGKIITVIPEPIDQFQGEYQDQIITQKGIEKALGKWSNEQVLLIRTMPNSTDKLTRKYSGANPPYFSKEAIEFINDLGVEHLMVDLPSVDREVDEGKLVAHKTFWNYPENPLKHKTITELIFVPNHVKDGQYLIQMQIMSIENDASPSKIMAHEIFSKNIEDK